MGRIRTIKPEFWTSAQVMECSPIARLFFIGLWNFCDDAGRHPASEKQLKALIFPSDDMPVENVRRMLDELSSNGLIKLYSIESKEYFEITGWAHQKIDRPQPAKYPACPPPLDEHSSNARDGEEGKGEEGKNRVSDETLVENETIKAKREGRERRQADVELIQAVVGDWNDLAASLRLSEVRDITPARQSAILARGRDLVGTFDFPDPRAGFNEIFARIRGSPFLRGENKDGWRCDFDFIVKPASFTKIMEGKYAARAATNGEQRRFG